MNKYIDTHGHIVSKFVEETDYQKQIDLAKSMGVEKIIMPGTTEADSKEIIEYCDGETTYATVGIHPGYAINMDSIAFMKDIDYSKVVAIGEIGLDWFQKHYPSHESQKEVFMAQLRIAMEKNLPVLIHCRDAIEDMYEILTMPEFKGLRFIMHSYAGGVEWIDRFNELDAYYSFNGITTFKNGKVNQAAAKAVPLNRIVSETDSPFLTPVPHRGEVNQPAYVKHVADFVANLRDEDDQVVLEALWNNAIRFFDIKN